MSRAVPVFLVVVLVASPGWVAGQGLPRREVRQAMLRAVEFFDSQVSVEGGYLWRYSADLTAREGEGGATVNTAWVQPPGTPSVGESLLEAYQRTGEDSILQAARRTAHALVRGQLVSGGWDYRIEFSPEARQRYRYRVDEDRPSARNTTTLDDDTTQAAVRFLMRMDQALEFDDAAIHAAVAYALAHLLEAQYPNGAWPQRFAAPPDPAKYPVRKASYPDDWSRVHPSDDYRDYYTFNDNAIATMIDTMFLAAEIYRDERYSAAARQAGDFILLAQMPDPQPAWAQQYNHQMHPAWARRFEPPAVTGGESQGILRTLMKLYRQTGERRFLEPVPRAIEYLQRSQLTDGRLARFYELRSNRPLYFTREYELTYNDDDLPTHYAFKVSSKLDSLREQYDRLRNSSPEPVQMAAPPAPVNMNPRLQAAARQAVAAQDPRGAWVEAGTLRTDRTGDVDRVIECRTFIQNLDVLSRFVSAE